MATYEQNLQNVLNATYGEEVRGSIVEAIEQCYTDANDVVKVSVTEPQTENTKIWIKPTTDECKVPTWEEFEEAEEEIVKLKSASNNSDAIEKGDDILQLGANNWKNGFLTSSGVEDDAYANKNKRLISVNYIPIGYWSKIHLSLLSGYEWSLFAYDSAKTFVAAYSNAWQTDQNVTIEMNSARESWKYVKVMIRRSQNDAIEPSEGMCFTFSKTSVKDITLTLAGVSSDAKATGEQIDERVTGVDNAFTFRLNNVSATLTRGYIDATTGKETANNSIFRSPFIYLPQNCILNITFPVGASGRVFWYNAKTAGKYVSPSDASLSGNVILARKGNYFRYAYQPAGTITGDTLDDNSAIIELAVPPKTQKQIYPTGWFVGNGTDPIDTTGTKNRLYSDIIRGVPVGSKIHIYKTSHLLCALMFYDQNDTYKGNSILQWDTNQPHDVSFTLDFSGLRFFFKRADNGAVTPEDAEGMYFSVECPEYQFSIGKTNGKTVSIMGDSICTFGGSVSDPGEERWSQSGNIYTYPGNRCRYPQTNLGVVDPHQTWWMRVIETLGMSLMINESWAGSRVSWDGSTEGGDIGADKHMASLTRIGHLQSGDNPPDIILVHGGGNDCVHNVTLGQVDYSDPTDISDYSDMPVSTFADAYRTMLIRMMHAYPNAKIVCLLPNSAKSFTEERLDGYCEIIKEICDFLCITWVDVRSFGMTAYNKNEFLGDDIHYNLKGARMYADGLIKKFLYDISMPEYTA